MKLKENSFNAKLYCWLYGKRTNDLPKSLCPYFWKLILAYILVIPYAIFTFPYALSEAFSKDYKNGDSTFFERLGLSFIIYLALFSLLTMGIVVGLFFTMYAKESFFGHMVPVGMLIWLIVIVVSLCYIISLTAEKIKNSKKKYDEYGRRIYTEKSPNIIVEFVKAKYNAYCPKIEWIKENKKDDE